MATFQLARGRPCRAGSARWPGTSARWLQGRRRLAILRLILNFFLVSRNGQRVRTKFRRRSAARKGSEPQA